MTHEELARIFKHCIITEGEELPNGNYTIDVNINNDEVFVEIDHFEFKD